MYVYAVRFWLDGEISLTDTFKAIAVYHETRNGKVLRRTYKEVADRARGFAYYLKKHGYRKVGILCTNTPAFLEAIYGIAAAGGVNVGWWNVR